MCRNVNFLIRDHPWLCLNESCTGEYDRRSIEASIVDAIERRFVSYQLQDLRCARCKTMKSENLRSTCDCSGEYVMAETRHDLTRTLQVTANVAEFHKLSTVAVVVEALREMIV